jgi:hypothetical protein
MIQFVDLKKGVCKNLMVTMLEQKQSSSAARDIRVCRIRQTGETREARAFLLNVEREMALDRLLELLEAEAVINPERAAHARANAMSRIARLRSAHATYALATSTEMQRVGAGAWLRRRHSVSECM